MLAGVTVALVQEQDAYFPKQSGAAADGKNSWLQGGASPRWEGMVDPVALEEDAADGLLRLAGTRTGWTALTLETSSSGVH